MIIEAMCQAQFRYIQHDWQLGGRPVTWEMIPERHRAKYRAHMELLLCAVESAAGQTFDSPSPAT